MYQNKKIVATIEARMTSTRLPGKVLMPLAGRPALERMIERLKRSKYLDEIVVATTVNQPDDAIVNLAKQLGVKFWRGSEDDVLSRVLDAAKSVKADIIVELTGDCPMADWRLVDRGIEEFFSGKFDCAANFNLTERTFPEGFEVQVYPTEILAEVAKLTDDPLDREHVSRYIYNHDEKYKIKFWQALPADGWPELRLTLDEKADYILLDKLFIKLLKINQDFSYTEAIEYLRSNSELLKINQHVQAKTI